MSAQDSVSAMASFVAKYDLGFMTTVADTDGSVWAHLGVNGHPAWLFVTSDGRTKVHFGAYAEQEFASVLDGLAEGRLPR